MSLYEQFHSDINKKFMCNMIKDIIQKETNIDISLEPENYNSILSTFPKVFEENDVEEIEQMNKILLDQNVQTFLEKLKKPDPIMQSEFEKLLKERESQDTISSSTSETNIDTLISDINDLNERETQEQEQEQEQGQGQVQVQVQPKMDIEQPRVLKRKIKRVKEIQDEEEIVPQTININSSKRTNINSSRYNYKVDLSRNFIQTNDLQCVSKLIIPIEDNYLFTIPVLNLRIPELECDIHMQQDESIKGNHRTYGVYKPIETHQLPNKTLNRITIDISDITGKRYNTSDILKVNIIEIKKNKIYFTCSSINHLDYQIKDYIKIINNNSPSLTHIINEPLKIKKIHENIIICEYTGLSYLDSGIHTNIDMKIMNMSNQNILYFN